MFYYLIFPFAFIADHEHISISDQIIKLLDEEFKGHGIGYIFRKSLKKYIKKNKIKLPSSDFHFIK